MTEEVELPEIVRIAAIIELARAKHASEGEIEIDGNAKLSEGDENGCYVQAWVWVGFAETPFDKSVKVLPT